ncbi:transformation system protein [Helicobacter didelphidarum]|uniref:Transformation system protein n=1 Tax=Helicobacter didelphidarum TaxID=2040648 RepID=A0A3D8IHV7_9HELI|nr:ComF family protein [Helicobacter didelphidarum]RDU64234.1 transformation system protein [Helicobacter didelphidarum]
MYCLLCQHLNFSIICKKCLNNLWHIESKRELSNGFKVFSSFALSELKTLIYSKNNIIGSRIISRLGIFGVKRFFDYHQELLNLQKDSIAVVCVRNRIIGAYSHSAILAHCFKKYGFKVFYNALITQNDIRFTTLTKTQREETSREFHFKIHKHFSMIIIVDDIITTGETLLEASNIIAKNNHTPLFAWTLCDSRY